MQVPHTIDVPPDSTLMVNLRLGPSSAIEEISLSNRGNVLSTLERNVLLDEVQHGPVQDSL